MSRARDDKRRNRRRAFALYHDDGSRVGAFWLGEADGCQTGYLEDGTPFESTFSEGHEPGSHVLSVVRRLGYKGRVIVAEAVQS